MNKKRTFPTVAGAAGIILAVAVQAYSYSDQTTTERILKTNKYFVEFLNICLTNFAEDKTEDFKKSYEKHFNADVAFLQSDYRRAFKRVYSSQEDMEKLYRELLWNRYLEDAKKILDKLAPGIIRSKNERAKLYLSLGYRDRTVSWTYYTVGVNSNPKLYSYKLWKYEEAIKMARRAKRYGFLALFESRDIATKRIIYDRLCKNEMEKGNLFFNRFIGLVGSDKETESEKEKQYIDEVNKSYEEVLSDLEKKKSAQPEGADEKKTSSPGTFEKKVERRVRFRNEQRAAQYLLNGDFDRAEDIIRKYIDDFNFKLLDATIDVLAEEESKATDTEREKIGYTNYKVHLMDSYSRLSKKSSILDTIQDSVRVEDDVDDTGEEKSTDVDEGDDKTHRDEEGKEDKSEEK